jgi:hypothetical protein
VRRIEVITGMDSLSARVQRLLECSPFCGDLFIFRASM